MGHIVLDTMDFIAWVTLWWSNNVGHMCGFKPSRWVTLSGSYSVGHIEWVILSGSNLVGHTDWVILSGSH